MNMFCPKCGSLMRPIKKKKNVYLYCEKCKKAYKQEQKSIKLKKDVEKKEEIVVLEKDVVNLPVIEKRCPKCGNEKAFFWMQQTRSADEPPTQFFRCTKCKYTWREYK